jgi:hypothetical protein
MKKIYFSLFTLLTLTLSVGQNELTNPGFETWPGTASLDTPTNWFGSRSSIAASAVTQSTDAQEGSFSVALEVTGTSHKRFTNEVITATNEEYTLTYYAKGDGQLRNAFHDGGYSSYTAYTDLASSAGWVEMTYTFTPDAGDLEVIFSVRNTTGNGILIDNVVLSKTATLSNKTFEQSEFSVFPNPTSNGFVNIKTANNQPVAVVAYDVLGKQVLNTKLTTSRLNVSNLKAGVYILKLTQNGATTTKKLVIE